MKGCSYAGGLKQLGDVYAEMDKCVNSLVAGSVVDPNHEISKQIVDILTSVSVQGYLHVKDFAQRVNCMASLQMESSLELAGSMSSLRDMLLVCLKDGGRFCEAGDMPGLAGHLLSLGYIEDVSPSLQAAAEASEGGEDGSKLKAAFEDFLADISLIFGSATLPPSCR
mmetsp:Transcript_20611/g.57200  ORF Transcript_20611/g.57200 Transcript_20611/m.57200 type:complete len:168 (-) Transcript_20611:42-545(-)